MLGNLCLTKLQCPSSVIAGVVAPRYSSININKAIDPSVVVTNVDAVVQFRSCLDLASAFVIRLGFFMGFWTYV